MPLSVSTLNTQLETARSDRSAVEGQLDGQEPKKNPRWRQANALVSSLEKRLETAQIRTKSNTSDDEAADD
jgi:hypothetical protein